MRKPEIDYRTFRLSRLNDPQFAHLKLLGGWIWYFIMYFLTENLIPAESPAGSTIRSPSASGFSFPMYSGIF